MPLPVGSSVLMGSKSVESSLLGPVRMLVWVGHMRQVAVVLSLVQLQVRIVPRLERTEGSPLVLLARMLGRVRRLVLVRLPVRMRVPV